MYYLTKQPSKERRPHLKVMCLPDSCFMPWCNVAVKLLQKKRFRKFATTARCRNASRWIHKGQPGRQDISEKVQNGKAGCFTLLRRITKLKCVNSEVKSVNINPTKEVPSIGSMAPCRSHHGNHTRQERIIIWSGRNWILKHADWKNGRYVTGRLQWYQCLMQASSLGWYLHGQPAPLH